MHHRPHNWNKEPKGGILGAIASQQPAPARGQQPASAWLHGATNSLIGIVHIEKGEELGRIYEIRTESLSIGRSSEDDTFLQDIAVSRLHALIIDQGNGNYVLRDEGSANGTKVNGQPINNYPPYALQDGDRIQLGQTVFVFSRR